MSDSRKAPRELSRIAAVTVTYNRREMLLGCLDSLLNQTIQIDRIYVINNASTDSTVQVMGEQGYLSNPHVSLITLDRNLGGAGGFHAGVHRAYLEGYDWIWLMDDDALPSPDALATLLKNIPDQSLLEEIPFAICPRVINQYSGQPELHQHKYLTCLFVEKNVSVTGLSVIPISANAFVGPLMNRKCVDVCGLPIEKFFIWVDDLDYTYRISQAGRLLLDPSATVFHRDKSPGRPHPGRRYFGQRNFAYFLTRTVYKFTSNKSLLQLRITVSILLHLIRSFVYTLQYIRMRKYSFRECMMPVTGFFDGLRNKFVNPG